MVELNLNMLSGANCALKVEPDLCDDLVRFNVDFIVGSAC